MRCPPLVKIEYGFTIFEYPGVHPIQSVVYAHPPAGTYTSRPYAWLNTVFPAVSQPECPCGHQTAAWTAIALLDDQVYVVMEQCHAPADADPAPIPRDEKAIIAARRNVIRNLFIGFLQWIEAPEGPVPVFISWKFEV